MNYLSNSIDDRNNNLNAIRMVAATAVLVSHSFAIATGNPKLEPLRQALGATPGTMAVDVFFVTSGLLLTNSLSKKQDAVDFIVSRIARIYPALIVATLLTVLVLGTYFTTLPLSAYFGSAETQTYLLKTATLIRDIGYTLPGVFYDAPLRSQVNGSLWTLPIEIRMYGLLFVTWVACKLFKPNCRALPFRAAIVVLVVASGALHAYRTFHAGPDVAGHGLSRFIFFFFSGACFALYQHRVRLTPALLVATLLLMLASAFDATAFFVAWHLLIGYAIVLMAYVKVPLLAHYNKVGDYSYGVYIYAFAIQQALVALNPGISVAELTVYAFAATLGLSIFSWHCVESPCMRLKSRLLKHYAAIRSRKAAGSTPPLAGTAHE
jgi:peptidoglycan/LPS O-acetylase OafA/YrhL